MSFWLKIRDASGNLIVDGSTRMSRVLGMVYLPSGSVGSISDAGFLTGVPYWISLRPDTTTPGPTLTLVPPVIGVSGTVLNYDLTAPIPDHLVIYGVY